MEQLQLIDSVALSQMRQQLIKGRDETNSLNRLHRRQRKFSQMFLARSNQTFLEYFDGLSKVADSDIEVTYPMQQRTEKEVSEPPLSTEKDTFGRLAHIPPRVAAMPSFWASYQVELVRRGLIEPSYLIARPGGSESGRKRLEKSLNPTKRRAKVKRSELDACIRTFIRQFGGIPEVTGKISIFRDCRLSRSWWRGYFIQQVTGDFGEIAENYEQQLWDLLRLSTAPWDELASYGIRKLTSMNYRSVRSAFVESLRRSDIATRSSEQRRNNCQHSIEGIGIITANTALGLLSSDDVLRLIAPYVDRALAAHE